MKAKANIDPKTQSSTARPESIPHLDGEAVPESVIDKLAAALDREVGKSLAKATMGMSPPAVASAWIDWAMHLALSPGKQLKLLNSGLNKTRKLLPYAFRASMAAVRRQPAPEAVAAPEAHDRRFQGDKWDKFPFNTLSQSFLMARQWWQEATSDIEGMNKNHEALVSFMTHQVLDAISPYNVPFTNPDVIETTRAESGANLQRGAGMWLDDIKKKFATNSSLDTGDFTVGKNMAVTPGKVIFRNRLIELIQYQPMTDTVVAEPILIVPPWIMKYYILDLTPGKSLVQFLVEQGHTVFCISWKNPDKGDADLGLEDYLELGFMEALQAVNTVLPERKVNAVGYCAGGTLLAIAAATLARENDDRLATVSTFTAQTDCSEPGEIEMFLGDSQLAMIKDLMARDGYLDGKYMASAFNALNANELIWRPIVERYMLGQEQSWIELMAWNKDVTRVPYRLQLEWLQKIYLDNELAEDHYKVQGRNIHLSDIRVPMFYVGTTTDHVAPWKSVYKIHRLAPNCELTFCLTTGGHNAGIACGPAHPRRSHQLAVRSPGAAYINPDAWRAETPSNKGSWWPTWEKWLKSHASGMVAAPSQLGVAQDGYQPICDAPGTYVMQL